MMIAERVGGLEAINETLAGEENGPMRSREIWRSSPRAHEHGRL